MEKWMERKKIRDHCRTVCKGQCCYNVCGVKRCARPPLPCAIFLCDDLLTELFGFHNGRNYREKYLQVTSIVFGSNAWDMCDMGKIADDIAVEIPDGLIKALISLKYEPDIHEGNILGKKG